MDKKMLEFPVAIYGNLEKYNEVLTKARCRIFYKYGNRNGTYITDEAAEKLVASLHYVPVKGIYDEDDEDFTDHGYKNSQGRIYGIVPETNNFAWETHLDEDGVERTYACVDVLLFTALYTEASQIVNKPQSMELFAPGLEYHYEIIGGRRWAVFDECCFLGLQVLGDNVEPCFEGAAFYSLQESIENIVQRIESYALQYEKQQGGLKDMPELNFKMSDDQKYRAIWTLLNSEYNEEGNWVQTYSISAVYDDYALAFNYETGEYVRAYYAKDDANDSLTITETVKCYVMDITEKEFENELKAKCQDELMGIRKNFKNEAEPGLSNNKLEYAQAKKDKYNKLTAQEKQTMLIEQQLRIQELEAQLEIYGAGGMLETLKELSTQDEQLFNIVKGKCMSKADANTKNIISGMNYIDLVEADMAEQQKDLAIIDMRWDTPIFDVSMDGKSLDELIFGKENDMSNYYFNNSPVVGE